MTALHWTLAGAAGLAAVYCGLRLWQRQVFPPDHPRSPAHTRYTAALIALGTAIVLALLFALGEPMDAPPGF